MCGTLYPLFATRAKSKAGKDKTKRAIDLGITALVAALLHDLHTPDLHLPVLLPGWVPLVARAPEIVGSSLRSVDPRLAVDTVFEPALWMKVNYLCDLVKDVEVYLTFVPPTATLRMR